ncbi:MAG: aldolase catalytic domain-containing protein [Desulfuromonadaceae bacterium]|nr:aldolase catalytic domain-containing protein [Desulfuromonadaceae bacterium]
MRYIQILDCTLRDGGFVNDWNFGAGSIVSIIGRLVKAGIDIIEVGFIDQRRPYDFNRSIFPDTDSIKPIFKNLDKDKAMILGMIDFGTCPLEAITEQNNSVLDGIRVIFKKQQYCEALEYCAAIKNKGYRIFVNPVSVTSYSDEEMLDLIDKINTLAPQGVAIVDTYGLMHKQELLHYYDLLDKNLTAGTKIGYHAHNNFQLAYANSLELIALDSDRELIVDASLFGMGKSAGNTCTELVALHLNENYGKKYDMYQLLEAIDVDISKEFAKKQWGYSLNHFVAASNDCHPDYVSALIGKKTLSVKAINEILTKIEPPNKLSYNKALLENMYMEYQNKYIDDSGAYADLRNQLNNREILVIAPGKSIETHKTQILNFIKDKNPAVITINFIDDNYKPDFVFMGNSKRYSQFFNKIYMSGCNAKVICTSNISESNRKIDYTFNFNSLINDDDVIRDNPVLMLLRIMINMQIKKVYLAGFDGYANDTVSNYPEEYIPFLYCNDQVVLRNEAIKKAIASIQNNLSLELVTPSIYFR